VNIRNLVPALAIVTLTSTAGFAADTAPAVTFSGWVDTILTFADDDTTDNTATAKDEAAGSLRFTSDASIKAKWMVTDKLEAKINLYFDSEFADLQMREAYFAYKLNDTLTWSMGKYIDHLGWLSAEPTGLFTVNASLIGYTAPYGNDVLGTAMAFAPKDSAFNGSFHITNGYYTASDASNGDPSDGRENTDLGFGLDLIYNLPDKMGSVNLEFAYDMGSEANAGTTGGPNPTINGLGGDVFLAGLNATLTPSKPWMIGAEVQYLMTSEGETSTGGEIAGSDSDRLQFMGLVNYVIDGTPFPMSVTGMVQYVTIDFGAANSETENRLGVAVALMTNPLNSSNFGLNFEVGFFDTESEGGVLSTPSAVTDNNGLNVAVEGLISF
jgi:hypothetical protein